MKHHRIAVVLATAGLLAGPTFGQKLVDDDAPGDPAPGDPTISDPLENGTPQHPFDALSEAVAASPANGVVLVEPGRYTGPGNRALDVTKSLTIESRRGADETIFDLEGAASFMRIGSGEYVVLRGLTVQNGVGVATGGLEVDPGAETFVEHCILRGNRATGTGIAGGAITACGSICIQGTAFLGNRSAGFGGAFAIAADSDGLNTTHEVIHSTFRGNVAAQDGGAVWAVGIGSGLTRYLRASVLWENAALAGPSDHVGEEIPFSLALMECFVQGGWSGAGVLNESADPLFVGPRDFHVATDSPVIDLTGGLLCSFAPYDADQQVVDCGVPNADVGADEVRPITYTLGQPRAGASFTVAVAGEDPGRPVTLVVGSVLADPPIATVYGRLEIADPVPLRVRMPPTDAAGASSVTFELEGHAPGADLVLQALVGTRLAPATTVEVL